MASITSDIVFSANVTAAEQTKVLQTLADIILNGDADSRVVAETLLKSGITIDVQPQTVLGHSGLAEWGANLPQLNELIAAGDLRLEAALSFVTLRIAREEFDHPVYGDATLHGLLVHEGVHALTFARIFSSLSDAEARKHFDTTYEADEYRAKSAAAVYLLHRGDYFVSLARDLGQLNADSTDVDADAIKRQVAGLAGQPTFLAGMKSAGIKPRGSKKKWFDFWS